MPVKKKKHVVIDSLGHTVFIGENIFSQINKSLKQQYAQNKKFILVDENTHRYCLPQLIDQVPALLTAEVLEIDSGEEYKNIETCTQLWAALGELGGDRKSLLVNLGGGVIGDMGGFVASTFKRGIDFINIPTTLLSQVDASVGGKTGIDLHHLKNEVGTFAMPKAVYIYPPFIQTLPERQILSGFAEIIKHALIADSRKWKQLLGVSDLKSVDWSSIIEDSVAIKNKVVIKDPKEKGLRKILNFGHTIGHAVETYFLSHSKSPLLHGEAIAIGMICELYLSAKKRMLSAAKRDEAVKFILKTYGKYSIKELKFEELMFLIGKDKKNEGNKVNFTLLEDIGKAAYDCHCDAKIIRESLNYYEQLALK